MLRRNVTVEGCEWGGRMLDVRQCSGLRPPDDFGLCGKNCLGLDEMVPAANAARSRERD
jgi:hypothetical protein